MTTDIKVFTEPPRWVKRLQRLLDALRRWIHENWLVVMLSLGAGAAILVGIIPFLFQRDDPIQSRWNDVRKGIAVADSRFQVMRADVQVVGVTADGGKAYSANSIMKVVQAYRSNILEQIPSELIGMRDYVDDYFTRATEPLSRSELRLLGPNGPCSGCVPQDAVDSLYRFLSDRSQALASIDRIAIDLTTNSEPPNAKAEILYLSDTPYRSNTTNGTLRNVYRGKYKARVSLTDHKTGTYDDVNLIDDPRKTLVCGLPPAADRASATCRMTE